MINKHFFKTLLLFAVMIGFGLLLVFAVNIFDKDGFSSILNTAKVAK